SDSVVLGMGALGLAAGRKLLRIDGQVAKQADVARTAAAVRITPEDAELVHGGPSGRRGWMDALLTRLSPRYGALAREYGKVLEQRNAALRHGADAATTAVFGDRLAELGDEIVALRRRMIARADALGREAYADVAGPEKRFALRLLPSQGDRLLADALRDAAAEERARGTTTVGPHRDDLAIELHDRSVQTFGSRGEARTSALALRVAEHRLLSEKHGEPPILLLDDFSAELDADRRAYLLDLAERGPQALVTGTEPPPRAEHTLRIAAGEVRDDG
ncbi:MAG: DNA replication and repair protein RecF, partial [Trueperaceae bacterium]